MTQEMSKTYVKKTKKNLPRDYGRKGGGKMCIKEKQLFPIEDIRAIPTEVVFFFSSFL